MANETGKKGMGWLKGVLSPPSSSALQPELAEAAADSEMVIEEPASSVHMTEQPFAESGGHLFSKDQQDKIALDVIVSIESVLKERQLLTYKNKGLEDQLFTATDTINRFKQEQLKREQVLQEKNKEIRELENSLTNKQMSYDQLLEDYKEYQMNANMEYEKLSGQLDRQTMKYNKLSEESTQAQYQFMLKIKELEDSIRSLEIENQKVAEQYQKMMIEKSELLQSINDFTEKMSFSLAPKAPSLPK